MTSACLKSALFFRNKTKTLN